MVEKENGPDEYIDDLRQDIFERFKKLRDVLSWFWRWFEIIFEKFCDRFTLNIKFYPIPESLIEPYCYMESHLIISRVA